MPTPASDLQAPTISVIIPAHNAAPYIGETLTSLRYQGVPVTKLEVLVIDDASTDSTAAEAQALREVLPGLRVLSNDGPTAVHGPSAARNLGLEQARGEFIAFIDADDWFAPGHLATMLEALNRLQVDFVRSDVVHVEGKRRRVRTAPVACRDQALRTRDFIIHGWFSTMVDFPNPFCGLYRSALRDQGLLHFTTRFITAEDRHWNWLMFLQDLQFAVVDSTGPCYRREVAGSLTAEFTPRQLGFVDVFADLLERVRAQAADRVFEPKVLHNFLALYHWHYSNRAIIPPDLLKQMTAQVARTVAACSPQLVDQVFTSFKKQRQHDLLHLKRAISKARRAATAKEVAQ